MGIRTAWTVKTKDLPKFIEDVIKNHPVRQQYWNRWRRNIYYFYNEEDKIIALPEENRIIKEEDDDIKIKINRLLPIVRTFIAKTLKNDPIVEVLPWLPTEDEEEKAKNAEILMRYLWRKNHINEYLVPLLLSYVFVLGIGIAKTWWDMEAKAEVKEGDIVVLKEIGEVKADVVEPWGFFPDPDARLIEECRYVVHAYEMPLEEAEAIFNKKFKPERNIEEFIGRGGIPDDVVLVKEYWEKPNLKNKKGRYVVVINNEVVIKDDFPYVNPATGEAFYPFVRIVEMETLFRDFWGYPLLSNLLPIQKFYNAINTKILKNISAMADIFWAFPEGNISAGEITNTPGHIIFYNAREGQPYQIAPKPLPHHVITMKQFLQIEFEELSGQHEVSQGKAPYANMPASALQLLLEQDDTKLAPTIKQFYAALKELTVKMLRIAQINYDEPRLVRILGPNKERIIKEIVSDEIDFADVELVVSSSLPLTKQGKINFAIMLWNSGLVRDPRQILRLLELDSLDVFYRRETRDIERARRENKRLFELAFQFDAVPEIQQLQKEWESNPQIIWSVDLPVEVFDIDDHFVHIREHGDFMKSAKFEELPPIVQAMFKRHVAEHMRYIQQSMPAQGQKGKGTQAVMPGMESMQINPEAAREALLEAGLPLGTENVNITGGGENE